MKPKDSQIIQAQNTEIIPIQDEATALISQAIDKNVPVETMEKLMAMRRELNAEKAKAAYDTAMAKFQAECPVIEKTKQGYGYKYAPLESIVEQTKELRSACNFSYKFDTDETEKGLVIYCIVKHIAGHSEQSKAFIDKETTTKMNSSQQSGAVMTYGKRYAFVNAFGILTGDEDTDASTHVSPPAKTSLMQHNTQGGAEPKPGDAGVVKEITDLQKGDIIRLLGKLKKTSDDLNDLVKKRYFKDSYKELTFIQAQALIGFLTKKTNESVTEGITDEEIDEIAEGIDKESK